MEMSNGEADVLGLMANSEEAAMVSLRTAVTLMVFFSCCSVTYGFDLESRVAKNIREKFEAIHGLGAHEIVIEDHAGSVTLSGFVSTALDQERVVNIAKDVAGVKTVTNYLSVRTNAVVVPAVEDRSIPGGMADRVKLAIGSKLSFSGPYRLDIKVAEGLVTLSGSMSTAKDAEQAEKIAASVPGVTEVLNAIAVPK